MIRGLVFDVDDTLYDETDYVRGGFAEVARVGANEEVAAADIERWLLDAFDRGVRGDTIDQMLHAFPSVAERWTSAQLIDTYRAHAPQIHVAPETSQLLDELGARPIRLGVLSDGPAVSQRSKVNALGLARWFDPIVLTGELGTAFAKPAAAGFDRIARAWALDGPSLAYVADNPVKDFIGPRALGWTTIRLRHPRQLRHALEPVDLAASPDLEIGSLVQLAQLHGLTRQDKPAQGERSCM